MACASCGKKRRVVTHTSEAPTTKTVKPRTAPTLVLEDVTSPMIEGDTVLLEYLGPNVGTEPWYGATGKRYRFGRNAKHIRAWVALADVQFLLDSGLFKVVEQQAPLSVPPPQPPEPEPEPVLHFTPADLTVAEIKALELTAEQWAAVLDEEQAGKQRVTVIDHAEQQLA